VTSTQVATLLRDLRASRIELSRSGDKLRYRPVEAMTEDLVSRVAQHKAELLELLAGAPERGGVAARLTRRAISTRVVLLRHLPRLLAWVADTASELFRQQERYGLEFAAAWDEFVAGYVDEAELKASLDLWITKLREGARLFQEKCLLHIGPSPIWAFWTTYTPPFKAETGLSRLLREEVGYPSDREAGMPAGPGGEHA